MKTYLVVWFSSEGARPSNVTDRLLGMGFKPIEGAYDYEYEWGHEANVKEILEFADRLHLELQGSAVHFKLETF